MNHLRFAKTCAALLIGGAALLTTLPASAMGWFGHHHHRAGMDQLDPAKADQRLEHMIARLAADATAEQKAKIKDIAKAAMSDLKGIRQQLRAGHQKGMALLTAPQIDRTAIESLRIEQMRLAERASQRMSQALADAAEVLTPEQRAKLAARMAAHHKQ
ncbi:Spy/CpxP family protein refolding chaperone [Massilia sp. TS11]|uniref:Spy/CpxP family protein refolding chaperone n=1 Tax=Massilia sp. TS11 TaxID=2908003 RepID=UPI001EDC0421|nr:Spy/CpxP family protein refolding chaperone [Massilia sp. TS11]MCG2585681.1 Spy/CpxP family protein refolding chaperone [Massilia sp. TS11]